MSTASYIAQSHRKIPCLVTQGLGVPVIREENRAQQMQIAATVQSELGHSPFPQKTSFRRFASRSARLRDLGSWSGVEKRNETKQSDRSGSRDYAI
jgi:hypothetical protein